MKVLHTEQLGPEELAALTRDEAEFVYCSCDSMVTLEVKHRQQEKQVPRNTTAIFEFEMAMQKPALTMMNRGIAVDARGRAQMLLKRQQECAELERWIVRLAHAIWVQPLNPRSHPQLKDIFYEHMNCKRQYNFDKGEKKLSTNRACLEKLIAIDPWAQPLANAVLALRDAERKVSVLKSAIDQMGRFRASYNVAGTESGRWSSSKNVFGEGGNAQNITYELREIFIADPGMKIAYADLEQAESRVVAIESGDKNYIEVCNSGDMHTEVCKEIWTERQWTGNASEDKAIAEQPFYRHFTYRDMAKRGGHAYNYWGTPPTIAKHLKIPVKLAQMFQDRYFELFPGIPLWHAKVQEILQHEGALTTLWGRRRVFFARLKEDATLREAIAHGPQSTIADTLNQGLYRVWHELEYKRKLAQNPAYVEVLGQVHDAIIFQYPENQPQLVKEVTTLMTYTLHVGPLAVEIPVECNVGYNWKNLAFLGSAKEKAQVRIEPHEPFSYLDLTMK